MQSTRDTNCKPPTHSTRSLLLWLLIAACVLVDITIAGEVIVRRPAWPGAGGVIGLGLSLAQMSILVAWMIWGKWNVMLRVMVATCGAFGIGWIAALSTNNARSPDFAGWFAALLVYIAVLAIPLGIARASAYRIVTDGCDKEPAGNANNRWWQFSIWSLLAAMTGVALMLGALRYAYWLHQGFFNALMFFAILSTSTVLTLFSTFLLKRSWTAALLALVTSISAGALLQLTGNTLREEWFALIAMSCVHGTTVYAIVLVLKVAGYQLRQGVLTTE